MRRILFVVSLLTCAFTVPVLGQLTAPFTESFDSTTVPTGWTNNTADPWLIGGTLGYDASIVGDHTGTTGSLYAWVDGSGTTNSSAPLVTDSIDMGLLTTPELTFWLSSYNISNASSGYNTFTVDFYDGAVWHDSIYVHQGHLGNVWNYVVVDLTPYTISGKCLIRFDVNTTTSTTAFYNDIAIDDVVVHNAPPCPNILGFNVDTVDTTSAVVYWNPVSASGSYQLIWGPPGFNQSSPSLGYATTTDTTYTIDSLLVPGTCYEVWVRGDCGTNGYSSWSTTTFCTECTYANLTYYESFDNWPLNCWDMTGGSQTWAQYPNQGIAEANFWGWPDPNDGWMTSLPIDISVQAQIRYSWSHLYSSTYPNDALAIVVEKNSSGVWDTVQYLSGSTFSSPNAQNTSPGNPFVEEVIVLDSATYTGSMVRVRFVAISDFGPDLYIDDFYVEPVPPCIPPSVSTMGVSYATSDSAGVYWAGGSGNLTNIQWGPVGFTPGIGNIGSGSVPVTDSTFEIGGLSANTSYEFYVQDSCSQGGLSAWIGPFSFTTACTPTSMPYYENFDTWFPSCWDSAGGDFYWVPYAATTGNHALASFWSFSSGAALLTSPPIAITQDAQVRFDWSHLYSSFYPDDELMVRVKIFGTSTWDTILSLKGSQNFNDPSAGNTTPGNFITEDAILDPLKYTGQTVVIELRANADFGPNLYVDEFYVENAPSCPDLIGLKANGVIDTSAILRWNMAPSANQYQVWFGPAGFFQGTMTSGGFRTYVTSDSLYLDTLSPNTCYEFLVRSVCSVGDTSNWQGPVSFCTPCQSFTSPYFESYDIWPLSCWDMNGGANNWMIYNGTGGDNYAEANFWSVSSGEYHMTSPVVDLGAKSEVLYEWSHLYNSAYPDDQLIVVVNKLGTSTWDTLSNFIGSTFNDPTAASTTPGNFIQEIYQLDSAKYYMASVRVKLIGVSDFGPDLFINNFAIRPSVSRDLSLIDARFIRDGKCLTNNDTIEIDIVNNIGGTVNFSTEPLTVNYAVTGPVNTSGTVTVNSGTLLAGDTTQVRATNIDMSVDGVYSLQAWINPNGANLSAFGDTLVKSVTQTVYPIWSVDPDTVVVITNPADTVVLQANSPFLPGGKFFITEVCHFRGATSGAPAGGWPTYLTADDYIEITGVPNSDLGGLTLEQWSTTAMNSSYTFPQGTLLSPSGTAIIMTGQGAGTDDPTNFMYNGTGGTTTTYGSTGPAGRILKDGNGNIVDAVGYAGGTTYTFPATSGVTSADWSGNPPTSGSTAGIRLEGADVNSATNWVGSATSPQDPNALNQNVSLPAAGGVSGFSWSLNGNVIDTMPQTVVGPYSGSGTYAYIASFNTPCGMQSDTVTVIVSLNGCHLPGGVTATVNACNNITVNWSAAADSALVAYVPTGGVPTSAALVVADSSYTITGTMPNTSYDVYVSNVCSGDTSIPIGPITFNTGTTGAPVAMPTYNVNVYSVTFDASGSAGTGNTYSWDFGGGNTTTGVNPTYTFSTGGSKTVTLTVTNPCGSSDTTFTIDGVSLEELAIGASIALFPNPTEDIINFEIELENDDQVMVKVMSVNGQEIMVKSYDRTGTIQDQFDLSALADGVYVIKVETSKGSVNQRVVKQ